MKRNYYGYGIWDLPYWVIAVFIGCAGIIACLSYLAYSQEKTIQELNVKVIHYESSVDVMRAVKEVESWKKKLNDDTDWMWHCLDDERDLR